MQQDSRPTYECDECGADGAYECPPDNCPECGAFLSMVRQAPAADHV